MKKVFYSLLLLLNLTPVSLFAAEIQGKVIRVLDGDTIDVLQIDSSPS